MKVPPKRKGNLVWCFPAWVTSPLNESPSEKEGKCEALLYRSDCIGPLNESPSEKEGKSPERKGGGSAA